MMQPFPTPEGPEMAMERVRRGLRYFALNVRVYRNQEQREETSRGSRVLVWSASEREEAFWCPSVYDDTEGEGLASAARGMADEVA